jgi:O-antigen/teichoic acid export membrane protein
MSGGWTRLARRAGWTLVGQALSSCSNFLVTLWALATVSRGEFAALSLCLTTFLLCTQACRALVSTPVLLLHSEEPGTRVPAESRDALGAATAYGVVTGGIVGGAALLSAALGAGHADLFLVLAAALPALQYQDALRHVCIARHRPLLAAASDGSWVVLQLVGFAVLSWRGSTSATSLFATWAAAGVVAGAWTGGVVGAGPRLATAAAWLRRHASLWRRLVVELAANAGSYYLIAYGLAVLAGPDELGRLRAAQALFGPVSVLLLGGTVLGVPESIRARSDGGALRRFAVGLSAALAVLAAASGAVIYALLPVLGTGFLGGAWDTARPLLPLLAAFGAGIGASAGAVAALRAIDDGRWIVRAQLARGALAVAVGLPAAGTSGAGGALVALALAEWVFAAAAWARFARRPPATVVPDLVEREQDVPSLLAVAGIDVGSVG